ncbi:MAG TPA: AI-2E family transporter [Gaiellaceae bacterium]|nr:AI-2E family transporter [Gaiellaceae bacterium]
MRIPRIGHRRDRAERPPAPDENHQVVQIDVEELSAVFSAPRWLRDLGLASWLLVGVAALLAGLVLLIGATAAITQPVLAAFVVACVASPVVHWLRHRGVPRAAGAALVLLALIALALLIVVLVVGGITSQSDEIGSTASGAIDEIEGWLADAGLSEDGAASAGDTAQKDVSASGSTLIHGILSGIEGLASLALGLSFAALSLFFLLKDGPSMRRWINEHMGVEEAVARTITGNVIVSLRRYFGGVTIVAAFNAVVVGIGAVVLGVPLAGTIALVSFVTAYIPYIGAFVAGAFAVVLTLGSEGATDAIIMLVIVLLANGLLQNILQPIAFGATLGLNPLVVLIVTVGFGALFGMVGLVLAAPLTSAAVHISAELARAKAKAAREAELRTAPGPDEPEPVPG